MHDTHDANRRHWDEVTPVHVGSALYDVDGFLAASSVERLPVEPVLADVVQSYKNLKLKR